MLAHRANLISSSNAKNDVASPAPSPGFSGKIYGLVAPGYEMAESVANTMAGQEQPFTGSDMSTKLKLMGVDVASFGRYSGFKVEPEA